MSWRKLEDGAPEMAAFWKEQTERHRVAVIGTVRSDGSPRISNVEPCVLDGELYLGMLWRSRKALDLLRDPRIVLRNAICTSAGDEGELSLRGRAAEVRDAEVRRRYLEAVAGKIAWQEPFHLFSVDIESAALVTYGRGLQSVRLWPQGTAFERSY
jgi:hypothetical protein